MHNGASTSSFRIPNSAFRTSCKPRRSKGRSPLCQSGGCGFESRAGRSAKVRNGECGIRNEEKARILFHSALRIPHSELPRSGDVAQLVEASVSETDCCGFDSHRHHSCRWAGAPPGLISLASGFDSRACNSCRMRSVEFGIRNEKQEHRVLSLPFRTPNSALPEGSRIRFAGARC